MVISVMWAVWFKESPIQEFARWVILITIIVPQTVVGLGTMTENQGNYPQLVVLKRIDPLLQKTLFVSLLFTFFLFIPLLTLDFLWDLCKSKPLYCDSPDGQSGEGSSGKGSNGNNTDHYPHEGSRNYITLTLDGREVYQITIPVQWAELAVNIAPVFIPALATGFGLRTTFQMRRWRPFRDLNYIQTSVLFGCNFTISLISLRYLSHFFFLEL